VVIGWTDPEGARPFLGALLLGYYDPDGRLTYAGRVGTGINQPSLNGCGGGCNRWQPTKCPST
jgi:bifunctional non-homologous end joining protein LigD